MDLGIFSDWILIHEKGRPEFKRNFFLGVKGSKIETLEPMQSLSAAKKKYPAKKWIDATGRAVIPGLINGHTHLPMTLYRGAADDLPFKTWLFKKIIPLEKKTVEPHFVRVGSQLAALELIRFGVTTVADMYFYTPDAAHVWDEAGLRGALAAVFNDYPVPGNEEGGAAKWVKLFEEFNEEFKNHPRVQVALGPHAPYSCSDETLKTIVKLREKTGAPIHIHVSETQLEVEESRAKYQMTPIERLQKLGMVGHGVYYAHVVHPTSKDIEILAKTNTAVIHNPESNLKLGSGIAPIPELLNAGVNVGIGTDGSASNNDLGLFHEMDTAAKIQKERLKDSGVMGAHECVQMATLGGARALGLEKKIGSLEVGKEADLAIINLDYPHLKPIYELMSHLVYSMSGLEVETVVCAGKVLFEEGRYLTLDPTAIYAEVDEIQKRVLKVMAEKT